MNVYVPVILDFKRNFFMLVAYIYCLNILETLF